MPIYIEKVCHNCDESYEVDSRGGGRSTLCPACRKAKNNEAMRESNRGKVCSWCGERKPVTEFPYKKGLTFGRRTRSHACRDCMPWTIDRGDANVMCGLVDVMPWGYKMTKTCPLIDNCRERVALGLDPACFVPDRRTLLGFLCLGAEEKKRARKLYEVRLVGDKVLKDSIDNYLGYYAGGGA